MKRCIIIEILFIRIKVRNMEPIKYRIEKKICIKKHFNESCSKIEKKEERERGL